MPSPVPDPARASAPAPDTPPAPALARRGPWAVLVGVAGLVAAAAVLSRSASVPSAQEVYRGLVRAVLDAPGWAQRAVDVVAELGIVALTLLLLALTWRARSAGAADLARALLAGGGVVLAYLTSEVIKLVVAQPRPCAVPGIDVLAQCPGAGDWSLPSNHVTVAAALGAAVVLTAPRWALPAITAVLVVAGARVGVGVHLPNDVLTGMLLGPTVVAVVALLLDAPARRAVRAAGRRWPVVTHHA